MIEFDCPQCQHHITVPDSAAGNIKTCPKCESPVTVPNAPAAPMATSAASAAPASPETAAEARIPCPICGELIPAQAKKCRFCGELLGAAAHAGGQRPAVDVRPVSGAGNPELNRIWRYIREFWTTKFCAFVGRAPRREYWYVQLHYIALFVGIFLVLLFMESLGTIVLSIAINAMLIPGAALAYRRCHDANLSGKTGIALSLLPAISVDIIDVIPDDANEWDNTDGALSVFAVVLMALALIGWIVIGVLQGTKGANQYGPDPYENPDNDKPRDPTAA